MAEQGDSIKTRFGTRFGDDRYHHTHPKCPEWQGLPKRGDYGQREIATPTESFQVQRPDKEGREDCVRLRECYRCAELRRFDNNMK